MHRKLIALAALAVAIAAIAGVGYAAIPSSNGVISACKDSKGTLKVIDAEAGQTCNSNQQPLSWNQQGPAGAQGPAGVTGYEVVTAATGLGLQDKAYAAFCSDGKTPVGGGAWATNDDHNIIDDVALSRSVPQWGTPASNGWAAAAFATGQVTEPWQLIVYAICANVQ